MSHDHPLKELLNERVVLDTATQIVYIGNLVRMTDHVFVLTDADMHDCRDGHASKEVYLVEAYRDGVTPNRRRVIVMRSTVISVSALSDVIDD